MGEKNRCVSLVNRETKTEAKKLKKDEKKEIIASPKAEPDEIQCSRCEVKLESLPKRKNHERAIHVTSSSTQTSDNKCYDKNVQAYVSKLLEDKDIQTDEESSPTVEKYPCFYCGINIVIENHLYEHRIKCRGMVRMVSIHGLPDPGFREILSLYASRQPWFYN